MILGLMCIGPVRSQEKSIWQWPSPSYSALSGLASTAAAQGKCFVLCLMADGGGYEPECQDSCKVGQMQNLV